MQSVWAVDDSEAALEKVQEYLTPLVDSGEIFLRCFKSPLQLLVAFDQAETKPDLFILDVILPHMSGLSLLRCIRNRGCESMAILISMPQVKLEQEVLEKIVPQNHVDRILLKPLYPSELISAVRHALHCEV